MPDGGAAQVESWTWPGYGTYYKVNIKRTIKEVWCRKNTKLWAGWAGKEWMCQAGVHPWKNMPPKKAKIMDPKKTKKTVLTKTKKKVPVPTKP